MVPSDNVIERISPLSQTWKVSIKPDLLDSSRVAGWTKNSPFQFSAHPPSLYGRILTAPKVFP